MIILGIDPGTSCTGWGIINSATTKHTLIDYGVIRPKGKILSKKYAEIFDEINELLDKYEPDNMSIETQFVYKNPQAAIKIGMARAMAVLAATKKGISVYEYTPLKAKQAVTGSGRAKKEDVEKMISLLLNISKKIPLDASDALSLAICHAHFMKSPLHAPI